MSVHFVRLLRSKCWQDNAAHRSGVLFPGKRKWPARGKCRPRDFNRVEVTPLNKVVIRVDQRMNSIQTVAGQRPVSSASVVGRISRPDVSSSD